MVLKSTCKFHIHFVCNVVKYSFNFLFRHQCSDLYETLGVIIAHAYVLIGYWPPELARASVVAALTCGASRQLALQSFMEVVSEEESRVLNLLLNDYDKVPRDYVISILGSYDFR